MATVIDGKRTSELVRERVSGEAAEFVSATGHTPGLVTILVGEDPASQVYVRSKGERTREVGMASFHEQLPATASQDEVESAVARWNADHRVDGILVQLPLPGDLDSKPVLELIDPSKDVDGFHPVSVGRLVANQPGLRPCTPLGVMELLHTYEIPVTGAEAVVVGRSDIVGKPVALLLLHDHALAHARPRRSDPPGGHPRRRHRPPADDNRGHDQARRRGGRCRHQSHRRRAGGRCGLRIGVRGGRGDHAGARWRWPDDDRHAAFEHA